MKITFTRFKLLYRVYMAAQKCVSAVENNSRICTLALVQAVQELRAYEAKQLVATWGDGDLRTQRPSK